MRVLFLTITLLYTLSSWGQLRLDVSAFDSILGEVESGGPGFIATVIHKGEVVYERNEGLANIKKKTPINPETIFDVGSLGKQFTAMAILLLQEQGKIQLTDPVDKYLDKFPNIRTTITIDHLLSHSSGIRSYLALLEFQHKLRERYITYDQFWHDLRLQQQLSFYPGDAFAYNNTGYVLLAEIVEAVSGMTFQEFTRKQIFEPLNMTDTYFYNPQREHHGTFSYKWLDDKKKARKVYNEKKTVGDGSLFTTANDLKKWDKNFYNNTLGEGSPKLIESMEKSYTLNDGRPAFYGKGVNVENFGGYKLVEHSGNWDFFFSQYTRFPGFETSIIILSNTNQVNVRSKVEMLTDYIFKNVPRVGSTAVGPEAQLPLSAYEGTYINMHTKCNVRQIVSAGDDLYYLIPAPDQNIDYRLESPGYQHKNGVEFVSSQGGVIFFQLANDKAIRYRWQNSPDVYVRLVPDSSTASADSILTGKYYCEELDTKMRVKPTGEEGRLRLRGRWFHGKTITRLDENFFWFRKQNLVVEFTDGNMFFHTDRASNLRFEKIK